MFWYDSLLNIKMDAAGSNKNRRKLAKFKNNQIFAQTFVRLMEDAMNRYEIDDLPETCSKRVVLQSLLWHGSVVFFEKNGSLLALPGAPTGDLTVYGEPIAAEVFSANGMLNEQVKLFVPGSDIDSFLGKSDTVLRGEGKGVIVWENLCRFPFINSTIFYAQAIADTFRTLDVLRVHLKNPQIFFVEEAALANVERYLKDREDNVDALTEIAVGTGIFDPNKVKAVPTDPNGVAAISQTTALIEWYEAKYRELCGRENNSQMDKKGENLISAEVSVNDEYTELSVDKTLDVLNEYLDIVNKVFGTDMEAVKKEVEVDDDLFGDVGSGESRMADDGGRGDEEPDK